MREFFSALWTGFWWLWDAPLYEFSDMAAIVIEKAVYLLIVWFILRWMWRKTFSVGKKEKK